MSKNMLSSVKVRILSHVQTIHSPCLAQTGQTNLAEQQAKCKIQYTPQSYRIHLLNKECSLVRNWKVVKRKFFYLLNLLYLFSATPLWKTEH